MGGLFAFEVVSLPLSRMNQYQLTGITLDGKKFLLAVPKTATVQQLLDKAQRVSGRPLSGISHKGMRLEATRKLSNYDLNTRQLFQLHPRYVTRPNTTAINIPSARAELEAAFGDPAFHTARIERKALNNLANKYKLPNNVSGEIRKFMGGKTRKSRKSRRQTRRRR